MASDEYTRYTETLDALGHTPWTTVLQGAGKRVVPSREHECSQARCDLCFDRFCDFRDDMRAPCGRTKADAEALLLLRRMLTAAGTAQRGALQTIQAILRSPQSIEDTAVADLLSRLQPLTTDGSQESTLSTQRLLRHLLHGILGGYTQAEGRSLWARVLADPESLKRLDKTGMVPKPAYTQLIDAAALLSPGSLQDRDEIQRAATTTALSAFFDGLAAQAFLTELLKFKTQKNTSTPVGLANLRPQTLNLVLLTDNAVQAARLIETSWKASEILENANAEQIAFFVAGDNGARVAAKLGIPWLADYNAEVLLPFATLVDGIIVGSGNHPPMVATAAQVAEVPLLRLGVPASCDGFFEATVTHFSRRVRSNTPALSGKGNFVLLRDYLRRIEGRPRIAARRATVDAMQQGTLRGIALVYAGQLDAGQPEEIETLLRTLHTQGLLPIVAGAVALPAALAGWTDEHEATALLPFRRSFEDATGVLLPPVIVAGGAAELAATYLLLQRERLVRTDPLTLPIRFFLPTQFDPVGELMAISLAALGCEVTVAQQPDWQIRLFETGTGEPAQMEKGST
ncbi:MAG: hypothetical protein IMW91_02830 [Firmicutes bacterium]|nr:hypothetical protein [Bacillota bacterium]